MSTKSKYIVVQHREVYRLTEGLQRERASLLKQLDLLRYDQKENVATAVQTLQTSLSHYSNCPEYFYSREMNKHLRDERDMCYQVCVMYKQN